MRFSDPEWLPAGLAAAAILIFLWHRYDKRQQAALSKFVAANLRSHLTRSLSAAARRTQRGLYLGALLALFIALAGPLFGYRWEQVSRRGNDIIFAIDTSRSMLTPDVKPNRLARAKLAIDDFADQLDGDAVGIVAFAGSAYLVCPITLDYGAFHESLGALDTNIIPHGGTDIASAIAAAEEALRRRPGSDKILILVTDGEDLQGDALEAARAAGQSGLKIYTVGVGTAAGDLIPLPVNQGGGFVKDENGAFVKSRLDEPALKAIAAAAGGIYAPLGTQGEGLQAIFDSVFSTTAKHDLASRQQRVYIERYQWPLAASFAMLLASLMVGTRRRSTARKAVSRPAVAMRTALLVSLSASVAVAGALAPRTAEAASDDSTAPDPKKPVLDYNQGTSAYRAGQFPQAAKAFQEAISHAPVSGVKRLADQEDAYYNLGNTLYRAGQATLKTSPQETIQQWTDSVKAYDTALQLKADDADSRYNRDLVKRRLDALQKQQQDQGGGQGQPPPGQGGGSGQGQGGGRGQPPPGGQQGQPPPPGQGGQQGQPPPGGQQGQPPPPGQGGKQGQPPPGGQQGQQPPPGQSGQQGQPPPGQGGQQGQPPPGQSGQQGQPPPGQGGQQPPPPSQGGQQGQPPPGQGGQGQQSPSSAQAGQPPPKPGDQPDQGGQGAQSGQPPKDGTGSQSRSAGGQPQAADGEPQRGSGDEDGDEPRVAGQMSREEARELLDSEKADEHHRLGVPAQRRDPNDPPEKPFKNW